MRLRVEVMEGTSRWDLDFCVVGGIRLHFIQSINLKILSEERIEMEEGERQRLRVLEVCSGNAEVPTGPTDISMAAAEGMIFVDIMENCEMVLRTLSLLVVKSVPLVCLHGFGIT
jgi:hypothetical protein